MTELWMPNAVSDYDPDNLFDSMRAFQTEIDGEASEGRQINVAEVALRSLIERFGDMHDKAWGLSLTAGVAVIDDTSRSDYFAVVQNIGVIGSIDDLCVMRLSKHQIPVSLGLKIDIESVFHVDNPNDSNIVLASGKVPLNRVHYIEYDI